MTKGMQYTQHKVYIPYAYPCCTWLHLCTSRHRNHVTLCVCGANV